MKFEGTSAETPTRGRRVGSTTSAPRQVITAWEPPSVGCAGRKCSVEQLTADPGLRSIGRLSCTDAGVECQGLRVTPSSQPFDTGWLSAVAGHTGFTAHTQVRSAVRHPRPQMRHHGAAAMDLVEYPTNELLGADDRARTGDLDLGKVALYQLSYVRVGSSVVEAPPRAKHPGPDLVRTGARS